MNKPAHDPDPKVNAINHAMRFPLDQAVASAGARLIAFGACLRACHRS